MRCLYFKLKDKVFNKLGPIPHSDTETLEQILKSTFGEHRKLGSRTYPKYVNIITQLYMYNSLHRVLITATDAEYTPLQLTFFNNFENGPVGKGNYM